jgi:hypothetical protein
MSWSKVLFKGVYGFLLALSSSAISNPESIITLAGSGNAIKVSAIVAVLSSFLNWYKHQGEK